MKYNIYESYKPLLEDWKMHIDVVKEHIKGFSDLEATQLAILLENTRTEFEVARGRLSMGMGVINEVTDVSMINTPETAFDIITAVMPNLIANDIVSVQPLDRRTGQIFYLKFTYGTKKGGIAANSDMLTSSSGFTGNDYSGEVITDELIASAGAAQTIDYDLPYAPIKPGTIKLVAGTLTATDTDNGDGTGTFSGTLVSGTASNNSINYSSGALDLDIAITTEDTYAEWEYDLNDPNAPVSDINVSVESVPVVARPRKLKSLYMFDTAYDLKVSFGLDMDTIIMKATSGEIGFEIDNEIMTDLLNVAPNNINWDYNPPYRGMEIKEYRLTFIDAINEASNTILAATKRYEGTFIVTGKLGAIVIEGLGKEHFTRTSPGGVVGGPHLCGILEEKYKVYKNPNYPDDMILVGARGEMFIEAGYVYAPYLPVFATQLLVDENLKGKRGFCTIYAKKTVNANMYCTVTVIENKSANPAT